MRDDFMNAANNTSRDEMILKKLDSIDKNLEALLKSGGSYSQSTAKDRFESKQSKQQGPFGQHHANYGANRNARKGNYSFADSFEKAMMDALGGSELKKRVKQSISTFADTLGVDVENFGGELGTQLGKISANSIKNSGLGQKINEDLSKLVDKVFGQESNVNDILKNIKENPDADFSFLGEQLKSLDLGGFGNTVVKAGSGMLNVVNKLTAGIGGPLIVMKALEIAGEGVAEVLGGLSDLFSVFSTAANRYEESRKKNLELANRRLTEDVNTIIKKPFEILEKAANEVYDAWSANVRLIGGTQGYNKSDLQDLMSAFASRLQSEGLSSVISGTDLYNNLAKVIQSGLTGRAAEEFAYQATKYGAAIPNQDFFSFADTYASIAANAIAAGKSESEALQIANKSLEDFSNGLLYASRNLVGGYSTGLKSAEDIYSAATKIAQAAKSDNINSIASSLLAIQGYVGSIAPDLASNLSNTIYQLATGGNDSSIVALRSLAGINASNTEFLQALSRNPQSVLSSMFANLGKMFTQSPDAYMEKAEGYASLFGLSSEAFQRIDFVALANAIASMNTTSDVLEDNLELLREGQTTTTADQLKIAQINQYMIEEGLAYVIDNEAAQMIQQHMWDEQMAREMMEAEYGVNLVGGAASAIEKILAGIEKVINLLNPIAWLQKIGDIARTTEEGFALQEDVKQVLELGVVGQGKRSDLYNLITRNENLQLTNSLVNMLGGKSKYGIYTNDPLWQGLTTGAHFLTAGLYDGIRTIMHDEALGSYAKYADTSGRKLGPSSRYDWGNISKSSAAIASAALSSGLSEEVSNEVVANATRVVSASVSNVRDKVEQMLSDEYLMEQYVKQGKSYQEWRDSAYKFGISDIDAAISQAGYDVDKIEEYFSAKQVEAGAAEKLAQSEAEQMFKQAGIDFWTSQFWKEFNVPLIDKLQNIIQGQTDWMSFFNTSWIEGAWRNEYVGESGLFTKLLTEISNRFIEHTYYNRGYSYADVAEIQQQESAAKGDAVYALAEALTDNMVDLKDPQLQTNAILAQILIVVSAIMNQNNTTVGTMSLADSLSSLALGLTKQTPISETPT